MGSLLVRALGPLEALVDGVPAKLGGVKQRAVLACLCLRANAGVSVEVLAETVWPVHPPARPSAVIQVYIANLRKALDSDHGGAGGPRITRQAAGYALAVRDSELDLLRFQRLESDGRAAAAVPDLPGAAVALRAAVHLFRGPAFPDLVEADLLSPELADLEQRRLAAWEDLIEIELGLGRHAAVLGEVQALVRLHPFRERLWASLVVALYRVERQAEALAACQNARQVLVDELGIDPGPTLRHLEVAVLRQDPVLNPPTQPEDRSQRRRMERLPAPIGPIIGREDDLAEVERLFGSAGQARLVTVTGPGGAGKTRFALAVASRVGSAQLDGVVWVELGPLLHSSQVPAAIARALGLSDRAEIDVTEILVSFLRERQLLLVLDNFEHVERAWPIVTELLTAAPQLLVLVTSRRPLQLRAEHSYDLPPLMVPVLDPPPPLEVLRVVPAVEMFVACATAVRHDFQLTTGNAAAVSRLCRRLDGLPLALELAAAQLRHCSEDQLLAQVEANLTTIPAAVRDLPARQQTLAATIAWSHNLLTADERALFDQLGVFAGDPRPEAVALICCPDETLGQTEAVLSALGDHSLLRRYTADGTPRLGILQSIRDYARDQLGRGTAEQALRQRHGDYYRTLAETYGPQLFGPAQIEAVRHLQDANDDLRAALHWAAGPDGCTDTALRLIGDLWHYWELTGDITGPQAVAQAVIAQAEQADPAVAAPAFSGAATLAWLTGNITEAARLHNEALDAFRRTGDQDGVAWSLMCLGVQALEDGSPRATERLIDEALAIPDVSIRTQASAHMVLGVLALWANDLPAAQARYELSLELARRLGDRWTLGKALVNLADVAEVKGEYDTAVALLREALRNSRDIDDRVLVTFCVEALATLHLRANRPERAARLFGAMDAYRAEIVLPLNDHERERTATVIEEIRTATGPIRFAVAWAAGEVLTLTQAISEALQDAEPLNFRSSVA